MLRDLSPEWLEEAQRDDRCQHVGPTDGVTAAPTSSCNTIVTDGRTATCVSRRRRRRRRAHPRRRGTRPDVTFTQDHTHCRRHQRGRAVGAERVHDGPASECAATFARLVEQSGAFSDIEDALAGLRSKTLGVLTACPSCRSCKPTPNGSTTRYAGSKLERFTAAHLHRAQDGGATRRRTRTAHDLVSVGRRGKHLLLDFGELTFVVHLMQGGRLKEEETGKQPAKPKTGVARWRFADGRSLLLTEAGTERRPACGRSRATPRPSRRSSGSDPKPTTSTPSSCRAPAREPDATARVPCATNTSSPASAAGSRTRSVTGRKLSPFASTGKLTTDDAATLVDAIRACIDESLAYERGRDDMSSSADRPGSVHHREGETCPVCGDEIRAVEYRRYTSRLLPDLPDQRQDPRRQHHLEVPQVAECWCSRGAVAPLPTRSSRVGEAQMRPSSLTASRSSPSSPTLASMRALAEFVDVEALDDLVLAVVARDTGTTR